MQGIIPEIKNMPVYDYDPIGKPLRADDIAHIIMELRHQDEARRRGGWKPEYILSKAEALELPLSYLTWLGENYRVLVGSEVHNIVTERFAEK